MAVAGKVRGKVSSLGESPAWSNGWCYGDAIEARPFAGWNPLGD